MSYIPSSHFHRAGCSCQNCAARHAEQESADLREEANVLQTVMDRANKYREVLMFYANGGGIQDDDLDWQLDAEGFKFNVSGRRAREVLQGEKNEV